MKKKRKIENIHNVTLKAICSGNKNHYRELHGDDNTVSLHQTYAWYLETELYITVNKISPKFTRTYSLLMIFHVTWKVEVNTSTKANTSKYYIN